jgi:hypothetical protein
MAAACWMTMTTMVKLVLAAIKGDVYVNLIDHFEG